MRKATSYLQALKCWLGWHGDMVEKALITAVSLRSGKQRKVLWCAVCGTPRIGGCAHAHTHITRDCEFDYTICDDCKTCIGSVQVRFYA